MEKFKQKLIAIREILMDQGVLYNVKTTMLRNGLIDHGAVRGDKVTIVGYSNLGAVE